MFMVMLVVVLCLGIWRYAPWPIAGGLLS
jgi:hypothetical protein